MGANLNHLFLFLFSIIINFIIEKGSPLKKIIKGNEAKIFNLGIIFNLLLFLYKYFNFFSFVYQTSD